MEYKNLSEIKLLDMNPRKISDSQFKILCKSIQDNISYFEARPIILSDRTGEFIVIAGNQRYKAAKHLKLKKVPIYLMKDLSLEQEKEIVIRDNISNGDWDWDILNTGEWGEISDLEEWGLDIPKEFQVEAEAVEDDYEMPDVIETDIVLGDLFEIGQHRLLCGDSTSTDDFIKLLGEEIPDLVFADPPYGVEIVSKSSSKVGGGGETKFNKGTDGASNWVDAKEYSEIIGDDTTDTAREFYHSCISMGYKNFIIWGGNYFTDFLPPSMCWVIWDKENTGNFADVELAWTSYNKASKLYKWLWNGMSRKGERSVEGRTRVHPTQKPVGLFNDIFKDFEFNTVFDGFGGSGSTMVACYQVNKKCFMIEMSPDYVQVIIDRMRKLDPTLIIKKNGNAI